MRTLATALLSLLVIVTGLLLLISVAAPAGTITEMLQWTPRLNALLLQMDTINWKQVGFVAGVGFILLGAYGLLRLRRRRTPRISFRGEHGEMVIELKSIENTLNRVINTLPEVRRARVRVCPEKDGRRVQVRAEVMLQNCADQGLRRTAGLVSECIAEAVGRAMGLEEIATVRLVVKGVHVDARAAGRRLRDDVDARMDRESHRVAAAALAHPPLASVTLEEPQTALAAPSPASAPVEDLPLAVAAAPEESGESTAFRP